MRKTVKPGERGFVLVVALIVMLVATVVGIFAIQNTTIDTKISGNERGLVQLFNAADAAVSAGVAWFKANTHGGGDRLVAAEPAVAPVGTYFKSDRSLGKSGMAYNFEVESLDRSSQPPAGWDPHLYRRYFYRITGEGKNSASGNTKELEMGVSNVFRK